MNLEFVFKIIEEDEWKKAQKIGVYNGSSKDVEDGYIHFSEEQQIHETLKSLNLQENTEKKISTIKLKNKKYKKKSFKKKYFKKAI